MSYTNNSVYSNPRNLQKIYYPSTRQRDCHTDNRKDQIAPLHFHHVSEERENLTNLRLNHLPNLVPLEAIKGKYKVATQGYRSQNVSKKRGMNQVHPSTDNFDKDFMASFVIAVSISI